MSSFLGHEPPPPFSFLGYLRMTSPAKQSVFISYRRADSSAASRWLAQSIGANFGPRSLFIDTESIRTGSEWPRQIDEALQRATILVPVIGPQWLGVQDEYKRRRLDRPDDWVAREIAHALQAKLHIVPVLLNGARLPDAAAKALPESIERLTDYPNFELRDDRWETDLALLITKLAGLGLKRTTARPIRYPLPKIAIRDLTEDELSAVQRELPRWSLAISDLPGSTSKRTELHRVFEFASFEDAIRFMGAAADKISTLNHHPRWENIWRSVSVWLSTWDIGHKPSQLDLDLARFLEELRSSFPRSQAKNSQNN